MKEKNIPIIEHIDEEGKILDMVKGFAGLYYQKSNVLVNEYLAKKGLVYREDNHQHSVPICWRCKTRLIYAPQKAWFISIKKLKKDLLKTNENINWIPNHIKHGRFALGIKEAPDWCISRNRYWATPMPVWQCESCHEQKVLGSVSEIEKLSGKKVKDLHRPYIDKFVWNCPKCKGKMKRIPEVLDCWLESGSMPYGERHYPFANKEAFKASFPADFISEYVAQTRAWFYVMHVISNALFKTHCFKNVIVTGVIMGTDGRKMSKSYGNYPDPKKTIQNYGGDALRLFLMGSQLLLGKNVNVSEDEIKDRLKSVLLPMYNCLRYFGTYAKLHQFNPKKAVLGKNILDQWIIQKTNDFINKMDKHLSEYKIPLAIRLIQPYITDLSTWYIRLSRSRFAKGDMEALSTLYHVLKLMAQAVAPVTPFISEEIWQYLASKDDLSSVHLTDYPKAKQLSPADKKLMEEMDLVRVLVSLGHRIRKDKQIPVRQPLAKIDCYCQSKKLTNGYLDLIKLDLNVKELVWHKQKSDVNKIVLDLNISPELKEEGEARRIIRKIGAERKKLGLGFKDRVVVELPDWPKKFESEIKKKALVKKISRGEKFLIKLLK